MLWIYKRIKEKQEILNIGFYRFLRGFRLRIFYKIFRNARTDSINIRNIS